MREWSLREIKALSDYGWQVTQTFLKLGRPVKVQAWGFSRKDAIKNFQVAVYMESIARDDDPLQGFAEVVWNIAGIIDSVSKYIKGE